MSQFVMPAEADIQEFLSNDEFKNLDPAFAGMTVFPPFTA
jgi:hypothetical protein